MAPKRKATSSSLSSNGYTRLSFTEFCAARQRILEARRAGLSRDKWTTDPVLQEGRFCNIDRRDDFVTNELLEELRMRKAWSVRERVLLCAALRSTGSRRGEVASMAALIDAGREQPSSAARDGKAKAPLSPLCQALVAGEVRCGSGTYQLSLNRAQVASVIETMAQAVVTRVEAGGPFADVLEASDCVAELMTVGKRPQFSANETAKDLAYVEGLMKKTSAHRCRLGPGARKGLSLVRALQPAEYASPGLSDEAAIERLRAAMKEEECLDWVEAIDVEQALCEFSKYDAYCTGGVSAAKRFKPAGTSAD